MVTISPASALPQTGIDLSLCRTMPDWNSCGRLILATASRLKKARHNNRYFLIIDIFYVAKIRKKSVKAVKIIDFL
jgi:hypothetical protein